MPEPFISPPAIEFPRARVLLKGSGRHPTILIGRTDDVMVAGVRFLAVHSPVVEGIEPRTVVVHPGEVRTIEPLSEEEAVDCWRYWNPAAETARLKAELATATKYTNQIIEDRRKVIAAHAQMKEG